MDGVRPGACAGSAEGIGGVLQAPAGGVRAARGVRSWGLAGGVEEAWGPAAWPRRRLVAAAFRATTCFLSRRRHPKPQLGGADMAHSKRVLGPWGRNMR